MYMIISMLFSVAWCQHMWAVEDFPNPLTEPEKCGINRKSTICDPDSPPILSADQRAPIQAALEIFSEQEVECGKAEMGVAIVNYMKYNTTQYSQAIACGLMDRWGVGKKECNNGVTLILAIQDRKVFFCTGSGARKLLPDDEIQQIVLNMKPYLRSKDYAGAIECGVSEATQVITGHSFVSDANSFDYYGMVNISIFAIILATFGYCKWGNYRQDQQYERCRGTLTRIEREHANALAKQYKTFEGSCPICLESFVPDRCQSSPQEAAQPLTEENSDMAPPGCVSLRCGHGFHQECLASWEAQGTRGCQCPVCRSSEDSQARNRTPVARSSEAYWQTDRMFRLRRLHHYYPDYVTGNMITRASGDQSLILSADTGFLHRQPSYQRALERAKSGSTATGQHHYGGGSSGGGGGGGGGW